MIYRISSELSNILDIKPKKSTKQNAASLWGEWICHVTTLNADLGYSTDRVVIAMNAKTLFAVFFPFDALKEYEEFTQALFFFVYWSLSTECKEVEKMDIFGPDIITNKFIELAEKGEEDHLLSFKKAMVRYFKLGQKRCENAPFVVSLPEVICELNSRPHKDLGGRSPLELSMGLLRNKSCCLNQSNEMML